MGESLEILSQSVVSGASDMIFVTVGNHTANFNRLLTKVDQLVRDKVINDVFAQVGHSDYQPKFCKYKKFVGFLEFKEIIKQSEIVISHGGAGCIGSALFEKKVTIVVPRLKKFGEHTNDHQLQITRALERQGRVIAVYEIQNLGQAITEAKNFKPIKKNQESKVIQLIEDYLASLGLVS
jgi:UDP-N-acetylglucosamine transferase subunit ALG13